MSVLLKSNLPDLNLETALPFIERVIEEEYEQYPFVSEAIFNVGDDSHGIVQHTQVSSLAPAGEVGEASEVPSQKVYQGYATNFLAKKYGVLLQTSKESIDDQRIDVLSKNPRRLARAVASTREITAAAILNTAFTTAGSDGKVLCAIDHPLLAPGAGTSSNKLSTDADLDATSLKDLITVFRKQLDSAGNKINILPKTLLVPQDLEFKAYEVLRSTYLPDSPNNNVNSVGPNGIYKIEPMTWIYLTDPDAFFLVADKSEHELHWFWRQQPSVESDIEFKTEVALTKIVTRFSVGYSDWRGIAGTTGAG